MGMFDKLMFWKKNEPAPGGFDSSEPGAGSFDPGTMPQDPLSQDDPFSSPEPAGGIGPGPGSELGGGSAFPSMSSPSGLNQGPQNDVGMTNLEKDIQVLSSKLDAIRSQLELINQRIQKIEHIADESQKQPDSRYKW